MGVTTATVAVEKQHSFPVYLLQSGIEEAPEEVTEPLVTFGVTGGQEVHQDTVRDETYYLTASDDAQLNEFVSRPLKLFSVLWTVGSTTKNTYDPWSLWLNNPRVINRIGNYRYITGVMCLKFVVNGSPFHYGKTIVGVDYWPNLNTQNSEVGTPILLSQSQISVLPHISIDPSMGSAGCLEVPLYNPNTLSAIYYTEPIFQLWLTTINPLNAATLTPANLQITCYGWMKDVTLSSPTSTNATIMVPQSGTEYGETPVAKASSMVAKLSSSLSEAPFIGPYARATEMMASGISALASLFGFSRPCALKEETPMQNRCIGNLSNYNYTDSCTKFALDAKNEVTIDPRVVGIDGTDEMELAWMASKYALISSQVISSSATSDSTVVRWLCRPCFAGASSTVTAGTLYAPTPLAHVALPFQYWSGTLRFKIEVVASKMHKGKLRIVHDPSGYMPGISTSYWIQDTNLTNSYILDLDVERTIEFKVSWTNRNPFLQTTPLSTTYITTNSGDTLPVDLGKDNGSVGIHIVSPITGPISPTDIYLNIYMAGDSDLQLACPVENMTGLSTGYLLQYHSGLEPAQAESYQHQLAIQPKSSELKDKLSSIYVGERIKSLRTLLKRYDYVCTYCTKPTSATRGIIFLRNANFPHYWGSDPNGICVSADTVTLKYNPGRTTTLLNWFSPAYLARRGGLRHKYFVRSNAEDFFTFGRTVAERTVLGNHLLAASSYSQNTVYGQMDYESKTGPQSNQGATTNVYGLNPALEFETPYYSNARWEFAQDRAINTMGAATVPLTAHAVKAVYTAKTPVTIVMWAGFDRYVATAEDFSLSVYKCPPFVLAFNYTTPV